jgi:DNA-directed RNA polymerase subunit omega
MTKTITKEHLDKIDGNSFEFSILIAKRAKQILNGSRILIEETKGEKPIVTAIKEIEQGKITNQNIDDFSIIA